MCCVCSRDMLNIHALEAKCVLVQLRPRAVTLGQTSLAWPRGWITTGLQSLFTWAVRLIVAVILFFYCCPDKRQINVKITEHKKQKHWFRMLKWLCKVILLRFWYTGRVCVFRLLYFPARCHAGTCSFMIPPVLFFLLLLLIRLLLPVLFTKEVISSPGCRCWWLSSCSDHNTDSWKHAFLPVAVGLGAIPCAVFVIPICW